MESILTSLIIIAAMLACGVFIGIGIALGMESSMRMSGDGRTVILTWARTKKDDAA